MPNPRMREGATGDSDEESSFTSFGPSGVPLDDALVAENHKRPPSKQDVMATTTAAAATKKSPPPSLPVQSEPPPPGPKMTPNHEVPSSGGSGFTVAQPPQPRAPNNTAVTQGSAADSTHAYSLSHRHYGSGNTTINTNGTPTTNGTATSAATAAAPRLADMPEESQNAVVSVEIKDGEDNEGEDDAVKLQDSDSDDDDDRGPVKADRRHPSARSSSPRGGGMTSTHTICSLTAVILIVIAAIVGMVVAVLLTYENNDDVDDDATGIRSDAVPLTRGTTTVACTVNADCRTALQMDASRCLDGQCTNPFYEQGCLGTLHTEWTDAVGQRTQRVRVCHSETDERTRRAGLCRDPDGGLEYTEVRILAQNWESPVVIAWIWQILLTEYLGVPVTLETGLPDTTLDFYDPAWRYEFGTANNLTAITNSVAQPGQEGCVPVAQENAGVSEQEDYRLCAHAIGEIWPTQVLRLRELRQRDPDAAEAPTGNGISGQQTWFVPLFTRQRNASLTHHTGLSGAHNRRTLAETFKRPTTWGDYCTQVSNSSCTIPDEYAKRAPATPEEEESFYDGWDTYKGHFRMTEENDCDANPDTCTGHFMDYPCGWSSYFEQQAYHLDIALSSSGNQPGSNGYSYGKMLQIIAAANATKSDLMFYWWITDPLYLTYFFTDFEFQQVVLPPATQECVDAAVTSDQRCSQEPEVRRGDPEGTCVEPPNTLQKVIAQSLFTISEGPEISEAQQSPAYSVIKDFTMTSVQLYDLFNIELQRNGDNPGLDLRYATCEWLVDNWEEITSAIVPGSFPRTTRYTEDFFDNRLSVSALCLSLVSMVTVLITAAITFAQRNRPVFREAQVGFIFILLVGLFFVTVGNVLTALPPSDPLCAASIWLINIGYTLELVPLIVKVSAILSIVSAAKKMKRITLNVRDLYLRVLAITLVVVAFLLVWTAVDIPRKDTEYTLTGDVASDGNTIVKKDFCCASESDAWRYAASGWFFILLLAACVLALQTVQHKTGYNESETLAVLIYSHGVFVVLRIITLTNDNEVDAHKFRSIIFSLDVLAALGIYFVSKFVTGDRSGDLDGDGLPASQALPLSEAEPYVDEDGGIDEDEDEEDVDAGEEQYEALGSNEPSGLTMSSADRVRRCELDLDLEPRGSMLERVATLEVQLFDQVQQGGVRSRLEVIEQQLFG